MSSLSSLPIHRPVKNAPPQSVLMKKVINKYSEVWCNFKVVCQNSVRILLVNL